VNIEQLMQEIASRLTAMEQTFNEQQLRALVENHLAALMGDAEFQRKMRFGSPQRALMGTKFARWNLSLADIEFLYDLQVSLAGQKRVSDVGTYAGPSEELRNTFNTLSEALYLSQDEIRKIDQQAIDNLFPRLPIGAFYGRDRDLAARGAWELTEAYQRAIRAMDTAESGYGSQLIGAQYVGDMWEAARRESRVMSLIDSFEMTAPTTYLPVEVDFPEMFYVSESTANNSSNYSTSKTGSNRVSVAAKKFVIHQMWSGEMEEDSIIPFIPFLRRQAELALAFYGDSLVLNGDDTNAATGNINLDDADPADTKHYLAFDGIRHAGLVDNTNNSKNLGAPVSITMFRDAKGRLVDTTYKHDWGHPNNQDDLVFVSDVETADAIALLDEIKVLDNNAGRPVFNGEVGRALGHPVIGSMAMSETEADGKVSNTAASNTLGQVTGFNRRGVKVGWRRRVKFETERLPASDQTRLVYSLRLGLGRFTPTGAASGIEWADTIYNITR
jgi:HK97 family phage major capsid protein